jgi:hypothetical protein
MKMKIKYKIIILQILNYFNLINKNYYIRIKIIMLMLVTFNKNYKIFK